jgi:glyoxylase-like metal-dependent hydrolase (beta-lactamase superfamily II)
VERTLLGKEARYPGGLQEVGEGAFAWLQPNGEWGESNAGVVAGDGEALLIDTLFDPHLTQRMLDAVAERVDEPIRTLVNTHADGDHVFGNQLLADAEIVATGAGAHLIREQSPGELQRFKRLARVMRTVGRLPVPIVGSLAVPRLPRVPLRVLGEYVGWMLSPFDFSDVRITPPTREFEGELVLDVGGREVRLIEVGPAHTPADLIVHVPDASIVFAADVLFVDVAPVMWAGPTSGWIAALERILELDPAVVVPGHGPVSDQSEVEVLRDYLAWVDAEARPRLAGGATVPDVARELLRSDEYRNAPWNWWDSPERILITVATIERHRRGAGGPISARERTALFAQVAVLAEEIQPELDRRLAVGGPEDLGATR